MASNRPMTIDEEWAEALHDLYPAQVTLLLLQFTRPDLTGGPELASASLVTYPGKLGETTLHGDRELLVPLLEAEVERRMRKSAHRMGRGT